ncbi:MAG: hypothetical protein ACOYLB_00965 [Phototrophicaceae bacterium]
MASLRNIFSQEWVKGVAYTLLAIGIAWALYSTWQFGKTEIALRGNSAYQIHQSGEEISPQTPTEQALLVASDIERRKLEAERWDAITAIGGGLIVLSLGWSILNFHTSSNQSL